jgi:hypothetical protein
MEWTREVVDLFLDLSNARSIVFPHSEFSIGFDVVFPQ